MTNNTEDKSEQIKEENGIYKIKGYTFWHLVDTVKPYVIRYLQERFPNDLILCELNKIDLVVLYEEIPVEIQSTIINKHINDKVYPIHSAFENAIRRQIEDNIENYNVCWFFFDEEYYRYLNESASSNISMNLDWLAKYVKGGNLKIFTIKYDGIIKELSYENLDFIRKISKTCEMQRNDDSRILIRNKLKIMKNVIIGHKFTQEEYDRFMSKFEKRDNRKILRHSEFLKKEMNERENLYGNIVESIGNLKLINNLLDMNHEYNIQAKYLGKYLGIFDGYGSSQKAKTVFRDHFNICQYFPGYIRNKEMWDRLKGKILNNSQFDSIFATKDNKKLEDY